MPYFIASIILAIFAGLYTYSSTRILRSGQDNINASLLAIIESLEEEKMSLREAYEQTIKGWARALELRDIETHGHSNRVADLTVRLAQAFNIKNGELEAIKRGALLHDIGKMGVPDSVLLKSTRLDPSEWAIMRRHPAIARELLYPIVYLRSSMDIPYCHHEHYDGTGYPQGIAGEDIPFSARLFSVVDVYDALTSRRSYREPWESLRALRYIQNESGTLFDPHVARRFVEMMGGLDGE